MAAPGSALLDIDLRLGAQRQPRLRLPANLRQLGAVGPVVPAPAPSSQPVVVAGNIVSGPKQQTMGKAQTPMAEYLQAGKGRDGTDAVLFGRPGQPLDTARFVKAVETDPHQFRFSVSLPRPAPFFPMRAYIETLMAQVEKDLQRPLDWMAAAHYDTAYPHAHVVVRGKDREEQPLYITTNYLSRGLRHRASQIATWLLGPDRSQARDQDRTTTQEPVTQQSVRRGLGPTAEQSRGQEMGL